MGFPDALTATLVAITIPSVCVSSFPAPKVSHVNPNRRLLEVVTAIVPEPSYESSSRRDPDPAHPYGLIHSNPRYGFRMGSGRMFIGALARHEKVVIVDRFETHILICVH